MFYYIYRKKYYDSAFNLVVYHNQPRIYPLVSHKNIDSNEEVIYEVHEAF